MEEDFWVQRAVHGDQAAFAQLVDHYKISVYNLAYRMLGNREDAEDAAQETFLRAYAQLRSYDSERKFSSWLLSITAHHCIDQLRRRRFTWLPIDAIDGFDWLWADSKQPDDEVIDGEDRDEVRRMLRTLPAKYRLVLVLRYWYDLSYREMAQITKMSEAAIKTRLHRAREMLAGQMHSEGQVSPTDVDTPVLNAETAYGQQGLIAHS